MRKLALLVAAVGFVAVLSVPPAHAQAKCGNDVCLGSAATEVHAKGNVVVDRPILSGTSSPVIVDGGLTVVGAVNAGVNSKIAAVTVATAASQDGGSTTPLIQFGYGAGSSGVLAVTFTKAFTSLPQCQCTHVGTTNLNGCVLTTASPPSTTTASFSVTSGGSDIIHWQCIGDK